MAGPDAFGAFAIAFTIYQFGLGSSRAFIGEPTLIRASAENEDATPLRGMLGSSILLGAIGLLVNLVAALFAGPYWQIFVVMGAAFPILMVADGARYWEFARGRANVAVILDSTWLAGQLALYGLVVLAGGSSVIAVVVTWALGALAAAIVFFVLRRTYPSVLQAQSWVRAHQGLSFRFFGEYLAVSGVQQSVVYVSVIFAGLAAAGAIRGGQVILGPLSMLTMGVAVVALPALSRRAKKSHRGPLLKTSVLISLMLLLSTLLYGAILTVLPPSWGEFLLGDTWSAGIALVPLLLLQLAVSNISYGATAGLRAMEAAKLSLRLRIGTVPFVLGLVILGAYLQGASGAILGAAVGGAIQAVFWWVAVVVTSRNIGKTDDNREDRRE
ncbi:hypothetical protein [Microbacterium lacus]|uniref:hypothetical protein n=1 Tax=Microbacterium lacus TaxID=415217 RepID=UPI0031E0FA6F